MYRLAEPIATHLFESIAPTKVPIDLNHGRVPARLVAGKGLDPKRNKISWR